VTRKRRFCYYRLASPLIAAMLESMKLVAAIEVPPRHRARSARDAAVRFARSCYDHLAGWAGVAITDALVAMGHIVLTDEGGEVTTPSHQRCGRRYQQPCCNKLAEMFACGRARYVSAVGKLSCGQCLSAHEGRKHRRPRGIPTSAATSTRFADSVIPSLYRPRIGSGKRRQFGMGRTVKS
jgi:hypothetical protein